MSRLSRDEWVQLDELLSKHGFGGYYDLVESLKIVLERLTSKDCSEIKDLPSVVGALLALEMSRT